MKRVKGLSLLAIAAIMTTTLHASDLKRTLKGSMKENYKIIPQEVDSLNDLFSQGIFYGRLRFNSFKYDWDDEGTKNKNHWTMGFGGSILYKTAYFRNFGFTAGFYSTNNPFHMDEEDTKYAKAGKDVYSRYNVYTDGDYGMNVLAQAYIEYKRNKTSVKVGRQIFESMLTASNDTKMIPNTFIGYTLQSAAIKDTKIKLAYLTKQKLRDHTKFHDVIAFGDNPDDPYAKWSENDDSAVHKGLKKSKLDAADIDTNLIVAEVINKSIKNLKLHANYTGVPDLVASATINVDYAFNLAGIKITPGFRYLKQFDDGAGEIGGASLKGKITATDARGYKTPNDLDSSLVGARVDIKKGAGKLRFGYTKVADEGDLVAPWRGYPTGGFTRAMAQYNWYANTKSYMIRADYDFGKAGLISGFKGLIRYVIQDFDDNKPDVQADSHVIHIDMVKNFAQIPNLEMKIRFGSEICHDIGDKADKTHNEYRLEFNYLF